MERVTEMHDRQFPYRLKRHFIHGRNFEIEKPLSDGLLAVDRAQKSEHVNETIAEFSKEIGIDKRLFQLLTVAIEERNSKIPEQQKYKLCNKDAPLRHRKLSYAIAYPEFFSCELSDKSQEEKTAEEEALQQLKEWPETTAWIDGIFTFKNLRIINGFSLVQTDRNDTVFRFALNLDATPTKWKAKQLLAAIRTLVAIVCDCYHDLAVLREKSKVVEPLKSILENFRGLLHKSIEKGVLKRMRHRLCGFLLPHLTTQYLFQYCNFPEQLLYKPFQVKLPHSLIYTVATDKLSDELATGTVYTAKLASFYKEY